MADKYALTSCGSSMGDKYGPMVIANAPASVESLKGKTIAIPGELTTAFLSLQLILGKGAKRGSPPVEGEPKPAFFYDVVMFDEIPQYVKDGKADAGLIIHEGQLTYETFGLHLIVDNGVWWHKKTGLPLPLGGNCIRKDLGPRVMQEVTDILKKSDSVQFGSSGRGGGIRAAVRPRSGQSAGRQVRRHVRERLDAGTTARVAGRRFRSC